MVLPPQPSPTRSLLTIFVGPYNKKDSDNLSSTKKLPITLSTLVYARPYDTLNNIFNLWKHSITLVFCDCQ